MKKLTSHLPKILIISVVLFFGALLLPAIPSGALRRAEATHAGNTAFQLKNAISAYYTEYRVYPAKLVSEGDVELSSNHELMDILLGSEKEGERTGLNPRRIAFFTGKQAKPLGNGKYRKGIVLNEGGTGELFDPWGNHYRVRLDTNLDNQVVAPSGTETAVEESILIWSAGKDGDFDTWRDNVYTW